MPFRASAWEAVPPRSSASQSGVAERVHLAEQRFDARLHLFAVATQGIQLALGFRHLLASGGEVAFKGLLFGEELRFLAEERLLLRAETGDQLHRPENAFFKMEESVGIGCHDGSLLGVHASYSTAFGAVIRMAFAGFPRECAISYADAAFFAVATRSANAASSAIAISESILRLRSTPAAFNPPMNLL